MNLYQQHRVKLIQLDTQLIVDILNWWQNPPGFLALPITPELPADAVVLDVHTNFSRRTIDALVASAEWPECLIGQEPERIPGVVTEFRVVEFPERREHVAECCSSVPDNSPPPPPAPPNPREL